MNMVKDFGKTFFLKKSPKIIFGFFLRFLGIFAIFSIFSIFAISNFRIEKTKFEIEKLCQCLFPFGF